MKITPTALPDVQADRAARVRRRARLLPRELERAHASPTAGHRRRASCRTTTRAPRRGVLRGLHYQYPTWQGKLVLAIDRRDLRCRRRHPPRLRRPSASGTGMMLDGRKPRAAVHPARIRARLPRAERDRATCCTSAPTTSAPGEEHTLALERSGAGHRLAGERTRCCPDKDAQGTRAPGRPFIPG
ncbi:MAG: dTDP-4-dehydrorhamnose 3,5-epimerase [Chromatiales bacterium]|nr:dTDP-4-dehydrorhamnose 3,5-epimerase [Chromatiales bacterium]